MKANRKFVDGEEAVSAVIGVILMVAITVAIAATVYVYVSGMIGGQSGKTTTVTMSVYDTVADENRIVWLVAGMEGDPVEWGDLVFSVLDSAGADKGLTERGETDPGDNEGIWYNNNDDDSHISEGDTVVVDVGTTDDDGYYVFIISDTNGGTVYKSGEKKY